MKVLGLVSYPIESPATRYRLSQYVQSLADRGIELTVNPFLTSEGFARQHRPGNIVQKSFSLLPLVGRKMLEAMSAHNYDLLYIEREAMFFGPAVFEWLFKTIGRMPLVLDLDDSTYIPYTSPTYGRAGSVFKFFGKTDSLIKQAAIVTCGNPYIAAHVEKLGTPSVIIPTVVDTGKFTPVEKNNETPVIGWIGTHSTFVFLEKLFPVLRRLAEKHKFVLRIVGSGVKNLDIPGVNIKNLEWNLKREISDFQTLDIGLYPLFPTESVTLERILGKSGFKAIQYMAVGVPFVMSPLGICGDMGEPGRTHFNAVSDEDWYNAVDTLLSDVPRRREMGARGRKHSLENYMVAAQADILAKTFKDVLSNVSVRTR